MGQTAMVISLHRQPLVCLSSPLVRAWAEPGGAAAGARCGRPEPHHRAPGRRREHGRHPRRPERGHQHGAHAAGGVPPARAPALQRARRCCAAFAAAAACLPVQLHTSSGAGVLLSAWQQSTAEGGAGAALPDSEGTQHASHAANLVKARARLPARLPAHPPCTPGAFVEPPCATCDQRTCTGSRKGAERCAGVLGALHPRHNARRLGGLHVRRGRRQGPAARQRGGRRGASRCAGPVGALPGRPSPALQCALQPCGPPPARPAPGRGGALRASPAAACLCPWLRRGAPTVWACAARTTMA